MSRKRILIILLSLFMLLVLSAAVPAMRESEVSLTRVWVQFEPGGEKFVLNALQRAGAEFHYYFNEFDAYVVTVPQASIPSLRANSRISHIEEDAPRYLAGVGQQVPYGVDSVQAREVWDADYNNVFDEGAPTGKDKTICIIDTGIFDRHEDLAGANIVGGVSMVRGEDWYNEANGHGTHVAGTIAAVNNSLGVVGVSPEVNLFIVKYFDNAGGVQWGSNLIIATSHCALAGADIISMSLSGTRAGFLEEFWFNKLYQAGILSVAAASNDGVSTYHYPASYDSVVSVGAVDSDNVHASFSNFNDQVELSAPGVGVLSTVPYYSENNLTVNDTVYDGFQVEFAANGEVSGTLANGGLCGVPIKTPDLTGQIVMCQRGDNSFYEKVMFAQNAGAAGVVIYNNEPGDLHATLGDGNYSSIPAITLSQSVGESIVADFLGDPASLNSVFQMGVSGYEYYDGTSMATPHVSAVAALLWSYSPLSRANDIRFAMDVSALDLGVRGRDDYYGFGLVQAKAGIDFLGAVGDYAPTVDILLPVEKMVIALDASFSVQGSAIDAKDGDLSGSIQWYIDGAFAFSGNSSLIPPMAAGHHTIEAFVRDSAGNQASDSIEIFIGDLAAARFVEFQSGSDYSAREEIVFYAKVTGATGAISGATIHAIVTTPKGGTMVLTGTTDNFGLATFRFIHNTFRHGTGLFIVDLEAEVPGYFPAYDSGSFTIQ